MTKNKKGQHMSDKEELLESLQKQKSMIINNINRVKDSITEHTISFNQLELECRLDILNSYIDKVMDLQNEIEALDSTNESRADLETVCVTTKSLLLSKLSKNRRPNIADMTINTAGHHSRLPLQRLPKFSGGYAEFKNFISLFENLVDSDESLTEIEKFNHLLSCLTDEALGTVKAFQVNEANYPKALASLKRVYDNTCLIFFDNICKLMELPPMTKPTASGLRSIIDSISALYDSLLSIGDDKSIANCMLIYLAMTKVDPITKSKWEEQLDYTKLPTWVECENALNKRFQHMSADEASSTKQRQYKQKHEAPPRKKTNFSFSKSNTQSIKCFLCKSSEHTIDQCPTFSLMSVSQRFEFAKTDSLCINCLRKGHSVSRCKAKRCSVCKRPHNVLLHKYTDNLQQSSVEPFVARPLQNNRDLFEQSTSGACVNYSSGNNDQTVLATALVKVRSCSGEYLLARALLDSCSQVNLITEEMAQRLRLKRENDVLTLVGVGGKNTTSKQKVSVCVRSRVNACEFMMDYRILTSVSSNHPDTLLPFKNFCIPPNIKLADPYFYKSQKVDMLIGVEIFYDLLCVGQIKVNSATPTLQKTLLGWVVAGKYGTPNIHLAKTCNVVSNSSDSVSLNELVQKFWEFEQIPKGSPMSFYTTEQQMCENLFVQNATRQASGRFLVSLPFKSDSSQLGQSFEIAKRRFLALERKLCRNPELRAMYMDFMKEYLALGHMSLMMNDVPAKHYFIPHQCVLRPSSTSTKLRVVFDASSKSSSGMSLNDILLVGPTIQEDLYSILLRFRLNKFALTADITKMYRQVEIDEADRNFQLILWREYAEQPVQIYRLNTVTYGTAPAPFLAIRCLSELSNCNKEQYPEGCSVIRRDFYVDDLITGADDFASLEKIRNQVKTILESAGFQLAKWFSNHSSYDNTLKVEKQIDFNDGDVTKTLGIIWVPREDIFKFSLDVSFQELPATKRNILSVSARLFDPLGLLCPIVTKAKILLQELWLNKLDWDESIPQSLESSWTDFKESLSQLNTLKIPRYVKTRSQSKVEIHGFADASQRAYGCCLYVRTRDNDNEVHNELLTAKSKVAPLKKISLPRLELCAIHLLSTLWSRVKDLLNFEVAAVTFWTDSEIALYWVKTHPSRLNTFVGNRVADIQCNTVNIMWRHVPSKSNPADIVSRGCNVIELKNSIWFKGPPFLTLESSNWPTNPHFRPTPEIECLEKRKTVSLFVQDDSIVIKLISKHSNYQKVLRIVSYMYRFISVARKQKKEIKSEIISARELKFAFLKIVERIQQFEFVDEIRKMKRGEKLPFHIQKLNPFFHNFKENSYELELLRVGGRLINANIPYDAKFPLLLPKQSYFIPLYLRHMHVTNYHAGAKALLSISRQQTWILGAREACTKVVQKCIHCFRYKPKLLRQVMGNLPADRLRSMQPFLICGVDFCGPVYITLKIRGRPPIKMYIAIFVCFASKAVHIELVSDLSTNSFISCFKRFIARRGRPKRIYSDNATNFVGASRQLRELHEAYSKEIDHIQLFVAQKGIEFVFIPPRAPHFGGLWEAAVKSAKHLMVRTLGNALLTTEEMTTALAEIEAILNSRPLVPMSQDPNDGEVITPGHLIIGAPLTSLPPEFATDESNGKTKFSKSWRQLCTLRQSFWKIWSKEYLHELQQRNKWVHVQPNLAIGRLVLIHDDNCPPQHWLVGRVQDVTTGQDGRVRIADVKTKTGILRRPIVKLALLPVD